MESAILDALMQVPIVAIFIWFILKWTDKQNEAMDKRDAKFLKSLADEREHRVEMLETEREHRASLAERLAEALSTIDTNVIRAIDKLDLLITTMGTHDARAEQYIHSATEKRKE